MKFVTNLVAVIFVTVTFNCVKSDDLDWWQKTVIYQVYPRSFMDSDGDGIGDLKGIEHKADYFKELGVGAVWLSPIYKSPMKDFGYDISDYLGIYEKFGTMDDFRNLKKKLHSIGVKLILDFVPNHSSDQSEWFKKSVKKIFPYSEYYVWKDPKGYTQNGDPIPPNNWISVFNYNLAWTFNKERNQFYLHQFLDKQPDLNYRSPYLRKEMENVIKFWLTQGVDGFRVDAVPYLIEDEHFRDEAYRDPSIPPNIYSNLIHNYTMDQNMTFDIIASWRKIVDDYTTSMNVSKRILLAEAYTDLKSTMKYYGTDNKPEAELPFNFQLITELNAQSNSLDVAKAIVDWMDMMPKGHWPNWVIGNHDNARVATRFGTEMVDAFNMLVTLLPGTAVTYCGEELGLENTFIRWDQTQDPQGLAAGKDKYIEASRDGCRTPMQWDDSLYSGFSTSNATWLPVNPNYWRVNLKQQQSTQRSHYNVYRQLVKARSLPVVQRGDLKIYTPTNWTLIFTRSLEKELTFIVVINMGTEILEPDLTQLGLSDHVYVYTSSINAEQVEGEEIGTTVGSFRLRPKAALVLTTGRVSSSSSAFKASLITIVLLILVKLYI